MADRGIKAFSRLATAYDDWFATPLGAFVGASEAAALRSLLGPPGARRVVDVGAGTGWSARLLADQGFQVLAVEPCPEMRSVGIERTHGLEIEWTDGRAESLPAAPGTLDGALFMTALEFVDDPGRSLTEALRVIAPGGWLAVGHLHPLSPWCALYRRLADAGDAPWRAARFLARDELEQMVGRPATEVRSAAYLAPGAEPPLDDADSAGRRAGNSPALELLLWR